ncbi:hypothetical protein SAY86_023952 [Trapa natans]|uniref:THH1/TOM1/TOM3 domain-containing protein n=1 Tax=Trapa natans TaxID=22666 RepID=A0AAN7R8D1_TRANT|nr:hypothetical protein SAY86_023952 [Trapa natans]
MKMSLVSVVGGGGEGGVGGCASMSTLIPIVALAGFDGALSLIALYQIIRIHLRNREAGWTRQKVLHLMLGCSNFGYVIFFMFTLVAHCEKWLCWSKMCGFIFMAYPKILFIAAFLSLLSFWIDLCHQANDEDEDADADNEESSARQVLLDSKVMHASISERRRTCCSFQNIEVRGRQKFVIVVVAVVFVLMLSFAVLIWIGMGKNAIDSLTVAQIYVHLCAVTSLLLGGALGYYGVLLFLKLRKLRSERSFADMWKVGDF